MAKKKCLLSRECVDRLHAWVLAHCPCALEDPEFFRGLLVVIDLELRAELEAEQARRWTGRIEPSEQ